jgi:hypothetical protein
MNGAIETLNTTTICEHPDAVGHMPMADHGRR